MPGRPFRCAVAAMTFAGVLVTDARGALPADSVDAEAGPPKAEQRANDLASGRGFSFYPSTPPFKAFRLGLGISYDAIDPQVVYGFNVRVPQITVDARYGLGKGWSLKGHLNSVWVVNELLLGGSFAFNAAPFSLEATASVGLYLGQLGSFSFDANMLSPEYRPELSLGYAFGNVALSLRGSLILMGPTTARVGDVWGGLDNAKVFAGHGEMLLVENALRSGSVWYFGLGLLTTRAYYQVWLLFPDSPSLYTYARAVAGYEF